MEAQVVVGEDEDNLLCKLIGRQVVGLAYVPDTDAAMISFDAECYVYFRVKDGRLTIEIEAPPFQ